VFMPCFIVDKVCEDIVDGVVNGVRIWSCSDAGDEEILVGGKTTEQV
jgi:hypothetical protein